MNNDFIKNQLSEVAYVILPGHLPVLGKTDIDTKKLYEDAYRYWKTFWTQVFIENGDRPH